MKDAGPITPREGPMPGDQTTVMNVTDDIFLGRHEAETLSIIVWCVGGVLLISLLFLLARIILAKKTHMLGVYEYLDSGYYDRSCRRLRIYISPQTYRTATESPTSREPLFLVPSGDISACQRPDIHTTQRQATLQSEFPRQTQRPQRLSRQYSDRAPVDNVVLTRHLRTGEYVNSLPIPNTQRQTQTVSLLEGDVSGSRATINGVVISPPAYNDVTNVSNHRLPSVVEQRSSQSESV